MKITLDMVPRLPDGKVDTDSWTYRAIRAQDEWALNPGAPVDGFFNLVLTPMIRGMFNDTEVSNFGDAPAQYLVGCDALRRWTNNVSLNWNRLTERNYRSDYPRLRRMLDRRRWYQELFRCRPGGFSGAWQRLATPTGLSVEDARANSDLKTWFVLHLAIGPEVDASSLRAPRKRPPLDGFQRQQQPVFPSASVALAGVMALMIEELEGKTNAEVEWCLREMNDVLQRFRERNEPPEAEGQVPAEPVRFLDPEYVVDFDPSGTEPPKE